MASVFPLTFSRTIARRLSGTTSIVLPIRANFSQSVLFNNFNSRFDVSSLLVSDVRWWAFSSVRLKSKDRGGKGKGKGKVGRVFFDADLFAQVVDHEGFKTEIDQVVENLRCDFASQFTLRTNAGVFDQLEVKTEDGDFALNELGTIAQKNPGLVVVNMASLPNYIPDVMKAIQESNLNVNPQHQNLEILLPLPKVTKDHRQRLSDGAKKRTESFKADLRKIAAKFTRLAKKSKDDRVSEDAIFAVETWIRQETDNAVAVGEESLKKKQEDLLDTGLK